MAEPSLAVPPASVVIPPLAIRETIVKVCGYVLRNGPTFELRMKQQESANPEFAYLRDDDPYNGYYTWLLEQLAAGTSPEVVVAAGDAATEESSTSNDTAPPPPLVFTTTLPPVLARDLAIVKATAFAVAVNGPPYAAELRDRDSSGQFAFVDPTHSLHQTYLAYVEQFKVVVSGGLVPTPDGLVQRAQARALAMKQEQAVQEAALEEARAERLNYASIDWDDFSVVATVVFSEVDMVSELPEPWDMEALKTRSLVAKGGDAGVDGNVSAAGDVRAAGESAGVESNEPAPPGRKVREAGARRSRTKRPAAGMVESPITGELIPELDMAEHMGKMLRDPRYKEERERYERKHGTYGSNLDDSGVWEGLERMAKRKRAGQD